MMRIKADWDSYLREIRTGQCNAVLDRCPRGVFAQALELGAGDGFLSTILADHCADLISTDLNDRRLSRQDCDRISYQICDAEQVGQRFEEKSFDLVFSSNLLEHLPDVDLALHGIHSVLKDDGITIHLLPNRNWKLATVLLHVPNKMAKFIDRILSGRIFRGAKVRKPHRQPSTRNNPKLGPKRRHRFFLARLLLPRIHGVAGSTVSEFIAFGKNRWVRRFERCGFRILDVRNLGFCSGYGFGCRRLRKLMERLGIHTSYAYIACKAGRESNYAEYFKP